MRKFVTVSVSLHVYLTETDRDRYRQRQRQRQGERAVAEETDPRSDRPNHDGMAAFSFMKTTQRACREPM